MSTPQVSGALWGAALGVINTVFALMATFGLVLNEDRRAAIIATLNATAAFLLILFHRRENGHAGS